MRTEPAGNFLRHAAPLVPLVFLAILTVALSTSTVSAQPDAAPPPSQTVLKDDQAKLDAASSLKDRTKLVLEMMDARLDRAEGALADQNFAAAYAELGRFHGLLDDSLKQLLDAGRRGYKTFDAFKKLEIGLRPFGPRLEGVRREMPLKYEEYIQNLIKHWRGTRASAADALFDDTVVRDN